jgi:hypothetical protein
MYITAYDSARVILVSVHTGGPLTHAEVDGIVAGIARAVDDARHAAGVGVSSLILVESVHAPTALQRKRIAEAAALVPHGQTAFVMKSRLMRAVATAIGWFRKGGANVQSIHGSYESARAWLVSRSGHPAAAFDALEHEVRLRLQRARNDALASAANGH